MKKIVSLILAIIMMLSVLVVGASAESKKSLVVLGDSIAEAYGIQNKDEASYGRIVADTLGYDCYNFGKNGDTSDNLLSKLGRNYKGMCDRIKKADIVVVSIGGNDFLKLKTEILSVAFAALVNNTKKLDAIKEQFEENFPQIISKLKSLNSNAQILVQTVYNGYTGLAHWGFGLGQKRVNDVIKSYLSENEGAFILVDLEPVFECHKEYIAVDTLHPSAVGNVAIAREIVNTLNANGLCDTTELVVNARGVDQIDGFSYNVRKFLNFFRKIFGIAKT